MKGFQDDGHEASLDGSLTVMSISCSSKDHVLVNFLSGQKCGDKSFKVISSHPASACRASGKRQFWFLGVPCQESERKLERLITDKCTRWQDPAYKEMKVAKKE